MTAYKNRYKEATAIGFYTRNKDNLDRLAVCAAFVLFVYLFVKVLFAYIAPFAAGFVLALAFEPLVALLDRRLRIHRGVLAFAAVLLLLFGIGSVVTVGVVRIANEARALAETLPHQMETAINGFNSLKENYFSILAFIPDELRAAVDKVGRSAADSFASAATTFVRSTSTSVVRVVPGTLVGIILCFISMFFFIRDRGTIAVMLSEKTPIPLKRGMIAIRRGLFDALGGYIRAEALVMLITGCICFFGLVVLRSPYALFPALLVAAFDFLPVFGPGFVLWPWALGSALSGDYRMAVGLLVIYAVLQVSRHVFEPNLLGEQLGMHPLLTLLSMYVGLKVFGVLGFFIGPFVLITLKILNGPGFWDALRKEDAL